MAEKSEPSSEQQSQLETILENQEKLAQQYEQYYEDHIAKLEQQMKEKREIKAQLREKNNENKKLRTEMNDFSNMSPVDKESFGTIENSAEEILMNEKTFDVENMPPEEMAKELKKLDTAYKKKLHKEQKYQEELAQRLDE